MKSPKFNSTTQKTFSIFWQYTSKYKAAFFTGSIGASLAVIAQSMVPPLIVARIFKDLQVDYQAHRAIDFKSFVPLLIIYAVAMLIGVIFWRLQAFYVWKFEINVKRDLMNDVFDHLESQSQRFHADRFGGALVSQTNKFTNAYERLMDDFIWYIVPSLTTLIVAIIVLAFIAWPYALLLSVIVITYLMLMFKRIIKQLPYNTKVAALESNQTAALADAITNVGTIRAFAGEAYESKRFAKSSHALYKSNKILSIEILKSEALSQVQTNGFQVLAILAGVLAVTNFNTNASLLYLLISYTQNITGQLWQFSRLIRNTNRSLGDAEEMTKILQIKPEVQNLESPKKAHIGRGEIRFSDVDFSYPENVENPLFTNLNLKIKPGEKVGLVGPSGGGKTTITQLILRFMDIESGEISIDGQNIANIKLHDLRSHIAYVSQEPILFHRTLAENIAYGDQEATTQVIEGIAKMANAHDFINKLPDKYETLVGERGVKLSGGQRQRIAIARAMLKNAPILVLDEATSALDSESEVLIQDALWKLMENRTALVIAHRLSTIQKMDRIIVLEEGEVVEQGSHKELLKLSGTYARLWSHQSGGFMED
jgi:ATP-binding cassette subfamily B protein